MRNAKKCLVFILSAVIIFGTLSGCGSKSGSAASSSPFDLAVCLATEPGTIDPTLNSALDSGTMLQHFFEGLMKWTDDGKGNATLTFGQAKSMDKTINSDGTVTYTFKLRSDAKWSDGKPVTSGDFVYSWQRLADHATGASYSYQIDMVKGYDAIANGTPTGEKAKGENGSETEVIKYADPSTLGVSAPDDDTFVVTLTYDCPYFREICAFPATFPLRKDIITSAGDKWTFDPSTYVSNGPYKLSEWIHNSHIKAVKNEYYYDVSKLGPASITFQLMDDANAMYSAFRSGTLQFIEEVPSDEVTTLLASGDLKLAEYLGTSFVCFQNQKTPFNDERVREAFSLAIDRNYIVNNVTKTGEVPADAYVPSGVSDVGGTGAKDFRTVGGGYYSVAAGDYTSNCKKAQELLAQAGYPDGKDFPAVEYLYGTDDRNKSLAEALQQMWKTALGVNVSLSNQDWATFGSNLQSGNYTIASMVFTADFNDPISFLDLWRTGNGNNISQYSSSEYDTAIDSAKTTPDASARMKSLHSAEGILMKDSAIAPLYFYTNMYMLDKNVKGLYYSPLGYYFFSYCTKTAG